MKNKPWTGFEIQKLRTYKELSLSLTDIATRLGRSWTAVNKKWNSLKNAPQPNLSDPEFSGINCVTSDGTFIPVKNPAHQKPNPDWENIPDNPTKEKTERAAYWKLEAQRLQGVLSSQQHERTAVDILVEKAVELAPISYHPPHVNFVRMKKSPASEQSAVLVFSDTHVGQVVKPEQTLGMGGYDFEIFLRRLARLERSIFSILKDHTTSHVPEIVVAMLGDMLQGNLQHSAEAGQTNTLFTQFYSAGHAIAQFLRNLSTIAPVRVHTAVGNHPRWGTQKRMPTDNRFSNLDQFLYSYLAALLRDVPTISIKLDEQPFSRFDVQGFHFLAGHGDHLRGGDKNLGIPNHAIGRNVNVHSQLAMRSGNPVPNYFLVGHLHRPITIPHCMGEYIVNGGFPGIDGYALSEAFNSSYPSQKFFLVHKKFGRSATYDLRLDLGDQTPHSYSLPDKFCCK